MKERNKAVPAVYLVLQKGHDVLLMRRQGSGYYDGWYSIPAGHVEAGELPLDSVIRESEEELGIRMVKKDLKLVHTLYRTKSDESGDRADYFFVATQWGGEPSIREPKKCDDIKWFSLDGLPENTMHYVRDVLGYVRDGISYSEFGLDRIVKKSGA